MCQLVASLEDFTPLSVERVEWEHIQKVLKENDGNISATARSLGKNRRALQRKLAKKPAAELSLIHISEPTRRH